MAWRTSEALVVDQLGRNYDNKTPLTAFIKSANVMVNAVVRCATTKGETLLDEQLEVIETLLACHYYQRHDPGFSSKNTGRSGAAFQGQTGLKLESTMYGQDALVMDTSGCLGALNTAGRARMLWIGKTKSEAIDYEDRN